MLFVSERCQKRNKSAQHLLSAAQRNSFLIMGWQITALQWNIRVAPNFPIIMSHWELEVPLMRATELFTPRGCRTNTVIMVQVAFSTIIIVCPFRLYIHTHISKTPEQAYLPKSFSRSFETAGIIFRNMKMPIAQFQINKQKWSCEITHWTVVSRSTSLDLRIIRLGVA